jgi:RNA polymerase sigma-70 factor (ECF subfamily)
LERTDEELYRAYREDGDRAAFGALVHRYERELYNYLRRFLGDATAAEDCFQTTFLQLHLKQDQFDASRRVRPWLYTIATNQAIDLQRQFKRQRMVSLDRNNGSDANDDEARTLQEMVHSSDPGPYERLAAAERADWIRNAVHELPEYLLSAVNLIYFQGLKYREAAEVLGLPVGTVKSRLHTAIERLNEAWQASHPPGEN